MSLKQRMDDLDMAQKHQLTQLVDTPAARRTDRLADGQTDGQTDTLLSDGDEIDLDLLQQEVGVGTDV